MRLLLIPFLLLILPLCALAQFSGSADFFFGSQTAPQTTPSSNVEIIIEGDTTAPSFYRGRREPTAGSTVRAIAVLTDGSNPDSYIYQWEIDGNILGGTAISGGNVVSFTAPLANEFLIRVFVLDADGNRIDSTQQYVTLSEPEIVFYEENLLRGATQIALPKEYILVGDEVSIYASPYFVSNNIFEQDHELVWEVEGDAVERDSQTLTLRNNGGTGLFHVEFSLRNLRTLTQYVRDAFTVTF